MNRTKLKAYAPKARREFIQAVTDRAAYYGLSEGKIEMIIEKGDVAIIGGKAFPRAIVAKRKRLEERIGQQGFDQVMEAMAYTWFNRFAAIRFMELHGYLDHGYRVISHPEGKDTPEIIEHAEHVDLPGLDREKVIELKIEGTKEAELYGMLLIVQCNALHQAMPFLFEKVDDETELLLPENLLHSDSLIRKLVNEIPEEEWKEVEIIGWLYQFYISEKKDQVIGKVVKSEDIPAATQLFTPNWIVKFMVQNTLGRQWVATYPDSPLKQQMEYYIEPAEQTPEVLEQLKAITPKTLNPEELTFLDPATGSGHILVEAYDLFKAIYQERGYRAKDIPRLILEKNLFGLEIDDRAAQLAAFALMMKAREDDRRIFDCNIQPHVLAIQESKGMDDQKITEALNAPILKVKLPPSEMLFEEMEEERAPLFSRRNLSIIGEISREDVAQLINLFEHGKTFGSLIRVPEELTKKLPGISERVNDILVYGDMFGQAAARLLIPLVDQALLLASNYNGVVTNPPYMGSKGMNGRLKSFAQGNYPDSKFDLFAMFIERNLDLAVKNGEVAMITMQSWMFLSSFEKLRAKMLNHKTILSMAHLGARAFDSIGGEVVSTTAFVIKNAQNLEYNGSYLRLIDGSCEADKKVILKTKRHDPFLVSAKDFNKIPGKPIAYWISDTMRSIFAKFLLLGEIASPRSGMTTGNNDKFIRLWFEVPFSSIGFGFSSEEEASQSDYKWYPYNKGGDYRKWYGNNEYVVNWHKAGLVILQYGRAYPRSRALYFKPGVTWTDVSSACFGVRNFDRGFLFDASGPSLFSENPKLLLGFLASNIAFTILKFLNPTLHFQAGNIASLPIAIYGDHPSASTVTQIVDQCLQLAKLDWDEEERSWDFKGDPMLSERRERSTAQTSYEQLQATKQSRIDHMKMLEQQNNSLFLESYGLQGELSSEISKDQVTLCRSHRGEDIKCLISYAIGCVLGRYSLDKPGLIYAHSGNEGFDPNEYKTFPASEDGIIPLTEIEWFEEDSANRVVEFTGMAWPKDHLEKNLTFLAESLNQNQGESSRETIRRYLATGFFRHHLSMYKKRPIYWLFSSGKLRAFQCLVYLHRYNEGTLSRIRIDYVIPLQGKMSARIDQLAGDITSATATSHRKKLEKEKDKLVKQLAELRTFDEKLRHYADLRISLDLDDGVKVNYGKFGDLLAEVKAITGTSED